MFVTFFMVDDMCLARFYSIYFGSTDNSGWFILVVIYHFALAMSSGFPCHVEWFPLSYRTTTPCHAERLPLVMSSVVETSSSLLCHSERSEESVNNITIAVRYPLFMFPCCDRAIFDSFSTGHDTQNCVWRSFTLFRMTEGVECPI